MVTPPIIFMVDVYSTTPPDSESPKQTIVICGESFTAVTTIKLSVLVGE